MTHACLARLDALRAEAIEVKAADTLKKDTTCLGCGAPMFTDRCHRRCAACRRKDVNDDRRAPSSRVCPALASPVERERLRAMLHEDVVHSSRYTSANKDGRKS